MLAFDIGVQVFNAVVRNEPLNSVITAKLGIKKRETPLYRVVRNEL